MAKYEMRVIPEPAEGTRYLAQSKHAGSMTIRGSEGDWTFLCGNCRDILVRDVGPDADIVHEYDGHEGFTPVATLAEMVFRCKGCGALNEVD